MNQYLSNLIVAAPNKKSDLKNLVTVFLLVILLALALMIFFVREGVILLDSVDEQNDKMVVQSLIADRQNMMERLIHDYAEWTDAFRNLHETPNQQFADENITNTLVTNYGIKNAIIMRFDKSIWLYYQNGKLQSPIPELNADIEHIVDLLRADYAANSGQPQKLNRTGFIDIGGKLHMASVNFIAALNDETGQTRPLPEKPSIMIFVRELNDATLDSWGKIYKIKNMNYVSNRNVASRFAPRTFSISITDIDKKTIGDLYWTPSLSSEIIIQNTAPKLIAVFIILIALGAIFAFFARRTINAELSTARQIESSRKFMQMVFDTDPTLIQVRDKNGVIYFCNRSAAVHFGKLPEHIMGQSLSSIVTDPTYAASTLKDDQKVIASGQDLQNQDITYDSARNLKVYQNFRRRIFAMDGQPMVLSASTDITAQKSAMDELQFARHRAEQAAKAKTEFLATISHEIRTPMNGILGFSQLLADTPLNNDQKEYISIIQNSSKSLLTVINDILDMSRIETGKMILENDIVDLTGIIDTVVSINLADAKSKNLSLIKNHIGEKLPMVRADQTRLSQIILNLISNAIKFTEKGGIEIRYQQLARNDNQTQIKIEVIDSGIGMDHETKSQIFQKFTQADSSKSRKFGGIGLGLSIAKELVEMMGGQIGVESQIARGSNFWVILNLPLAETKG